MEGNQENLSFKDRFEKFWGFKLSDVDVQRVEAIYKKLEEDYLNSKEIK